MRDKLNILFNVKFLYFFGFLLATVITALEVIRGTHYNYLVFAESTRDFWRGISPYTEEFCKLNLREFLYAPPFSVLFTPFALFPNAVGAFLWNLFNYSMFFLAVKMLPENIFPNKTRCFIFLYTLLLLGQSLLSFQYNVTVAYIYIFAWVLLEKKKYFLAILLIMISGLTKLYGIFELALLLCYPKLFKNILYVVLTAVVLVILPIIKFPFSELLSYYTGWLHILDVHQSSRIFESIFFVEPFSEFLLPNFRIIQLGSLAILGILFLLEHSRWKYEKYRVQSVAILMGWIVLASDSSEIHTYLIAITGFALWFWSKPHRNLTDKILLWSNFFLFCIVPVDILCPVPVMLFITRTLWLHVWIFCFTWLRMVYLTLISTDGWVDEIKMEKAAENDSIDIVFPCYNPHDGFIGNLSKVISSIRSTYPLRKIHIIISDDGSIRGFDSNVREKLIAEIPDLEIVISPHRGKGSAVRAGISKASSKYVVYSDIDVPYSIPTMTKVIDSLLDGNDVVIATRDENYYSKLTTSRKILSWGSKILNCLILGISHPDAQGGLKGISINSRKYILKTNIDGFLFDTQFIKAASSSVPRVRITEIKAQLSEGITMSGMPFKVIRHELLNFLKIIFS